MGLSRNSLFTVSGAAYFMGSCAGSIPLPLNYLERLNHPEERKGMKPRSPFDKSEKPRLCVCQKSRTAFKLGRALLSYNLANSQQSETFRSEWLTVLEFYFHNVISQLFRSSVLYCWSSEYHSHITHIWANGSERRVTHIMTFPKQLIHFWKVNLGHFPHLEKGSANSTSWHQRYPEPLHI